MSKRSGLGQKFYVVAIGSGPGYDISGDVGSIDTAESMFATLDTTGIDKSAHERIPGLGDGKLQYTGFWNNGAGGQHAVVSLLNGTAVRGVWLGSATEGDGLAFVISGILNNYPVARAAGGALTAKPTIDGYNGDFPDWGVLGLIGTLASGTLNRTAIDLGATGAAQTITANTKANPTVVTVAAHGFANGDSVSIVGSNSTVSIDGDWVVSGVTTNTFTVPVDTSGGASAGTAGTATLTSSRRGCVLAGVLLSIGSGTNFTIKAQTSADNGAVDAYADLTAAVTASLTAAAAESRVRTSTTLLVKRYVRLVGQGTYTNANAVGVFKRIQGAE